MINAFGKGDLISGVLEGGVFHALSGQSNASPNADHPFYLPGLPDFGVRTFTQSFPSVKANAPVTSDAVPEKGIFDALKYVIGGSDEQTSVFSAKEDLPANVTPSGNVTPSIDILGTIEGYLSRVAIVILGFIFVAVGLAMFKQPQAINIVSKVKGAL